MNSQTKNSEGNVEQYQRLLEGNVAVIRGKSAESTPGPDRFSVEIGTVSHYKKRRGVKIQQGEEGFCVPKGIHKGWVVVKPAESDERDIELTVQRDTFGDVELVLYCDIIGDVLRSSRVRADCFKEEGFDLDQENLDNDGRVLSPDLSQMLYDFQLGQGRFKTD